jgi:hypothetical protein
MGSPKASRKAAGDVLRFSRLSRARRSMLAAPASFLHRLVAIWRPSLLSFFPFSARWSRRNARASNFELSRFDVRRPCGFVRWASEIALADEAPAAWPRDFRSVMIDPHLSSAARHASLRLSKRCSAPRGGLA